MASGSGTTGDPGTPPKVADTTQPPQVHAPPRFDHDGGERDVMAGWAGPLPPPSVLGGFNQHVEDGAERVFRQFELEAEHRRAMDRERLTFQGRQLAFIRGERRLSQVLAGVYAFGALLLAFYALKEGHPTTAGIIATTSIASVVAAFLTFGRAGVTTTRSRTREQDAGQGGEHRSTKESPRSAPPRN
jgi:uncharacterized membrane protein